MGRVGIQIFFTQACFESSSVTGENSTPLGLHLKWLCKKSGETSIDVSIGIMAIFGGGRMEERTQGIWLVTVYYLLHKVTYLCYL